MNVYAVRWNWKIGPEHEANLTFIAARDEDTAKNIIATQNVTDDTGTVIEGYEPPVILSVRPVDDFYMVMRLNQNGEFDYELADDLQHDIEQKEFPELEKAVDAVPTTENPFADDPHVRAASKIGAQREALRHIARVA